MARTNDAPDYTPTPEELIARRNALRDRWDAGTERHRRTGSSIEEPYKLPSVSMEAFPEGWREPGEEPLELMPDDDDTA